jgi:hypothetical protein
MGKEGRRPDAVDGDILGSGIRVIVERNRRRNGGLDGRYRRITALPESRCCLPDPGQTNRA